MSIYIASFVLFYIIFSEVQNTSVVAGVDIVRTLFKILTVRFTWLLLFIFQQSIAGFTNLPQELLLQILPELPLKYALNTKYMCKNICKSIPASVYTIY